MLKAKNNFAEAVKKALPTWIRQILRCTYNCRLTDQYTHFSWSQEGEDMILRKYFANKKNGFYVDIGAHHPLRFSNTQHFYLQGWQGINVDALPGSMELFKRIRKRDINLEIGVGKQEGWAEYYMFNEPALNCFSKEISSKRNAKSDKYEIIGQCQVEILPLAAILKKHLPPGQIIDFLSVDVEGMDLTVLESNDWGLFRPNCVLSEILTTTWQELKKDPIVNFMKAKHYEIYAKSGHSVIFINVE